MKKVVVHFIVSTLCFISLQVQGQTIPVPRPNVHEQEIYSVVQYMPQYPGGSDSLLAFIGNNLVYPEEAKKAKVQGTIFAVFVINSEGYVTNTVILKGLGYGCDQEVLRVLQLMPQWKPGLRKDHKPVAVRQSIPIKFSL